MKRTIVNQAYKLNHLLKKLGYRVISNANHRSLVNRIEEYELQIIKLNFLLKIDSGNIAELIGMIERSPAQLYQDLFVLNELGFKRNGFFVEFGATDGKFLSNTHLLEKDFGWTGILAEPARTWHDDLRQNRSCVTDTGCVWSVSDSKLSFSEVVKPELSTIDEFKYKDFHVNSRQIHSTYEVKTITLMDLLSKYDAPDVVDYLSMDTEGSEYEILKNFDFSRYRFNVITIEHNYSPIREKIYELLTDNGYVRKHEEISLFDDWYVYPC